MYNFLWCTLPDFRKLQCRLWHRKWAHCISHNRESIAIFNADINRKGRICWSLVSNDMDCATWVSIYIENEKLLVLNRIPVECTRATYYRWNYVHIGTFMQIHEISTSLLNPKALQKGRPGTSNCKTKNAWQTQEVTVIILGLVSM